MTTKAAASYLNVAEVTIHKYVKDGLLEPAYKNWQDDGTKLFFWKTFKNWLKNDYFRNREPA